MLSVQHLSKRYGDLAAARDVSFQVAPGEIVGLLGPNGAGKTTIASIIAGLLAPDEGQVLIAGRPLRGDGDPAKRRIGLVPQDLALYEELRARENLRFFGALYDLDEAALDRAVEEALALVGLTARADERVKQFSGGMKRRLNLAAALLHDPDVLILDEPTVGVDPQSRNAIFENLEQLKRRGKSIVYTTHYMEEAERLCDRVVIIDHGKVVVDDTLRGLYRLVRATNKLQVEVETPGDGAWLDQVRALAGVEEARLDEGVLTVQFSDLTAGSAALLGWLAASKRAVVHLASERADLETVFLSLTGRSLRDS